MWRFIVDTINSLPGNWVLLGWLVFLFVVIAIATGLIEAFKVITTVLFEAIAIGTGKLVFMIVDTILAILLFPFTAIRWLWRRRRYRPHAPMLPGLKEIGSYISGILKPKPRRSYSDHERDRQKEDYFRKEEERQNRNNRQQQDDQNRQRQSDNSGPKSDQYGISYQRALEIFDLQHMAEFSEDDLKKRYRSLMGKVHPDRGGSNFFAQQANEALEVIKNRKGW